MKNQEYILKLLEQFKKAYGLAKVDLHSNELISHFYEWIYKRQIDGENFLRLLDEAEIDTDVISCAEVGKGKFDSILMPYNATIITPYYETFRNCQKPEDGKIITDTFDVIGGVPTLTDKNPIIPEMRIIKPEEIQTFMTFNPYADENIYRWAQLHNNKNYSIIFGVYGNIRDKDRDEKLQLLKRLKYLLFDSYTIDIDAVIGNNYYNITASDRLAKRKMLTK